jgi:hypothetical protein
VNVLRTCLVCGFAVLAVLIPGVVVQHVPPGLQRRRVYYLVGLIWSLLAAGVYAVLRDWDHDSPFAVQDALRVVALVSGALYVAHGLKERS